MSMGKLAGRVAIVTGGGNGLGAECARVLAEHGASVAVVDVDGDAANRVAESILAQGMPAQGFRADVSSEEDVKAVIDQRQRDRDLANLDMEAFDRAIAVNLRGAVLCTKYVIPVMLEQGKGSIIFATSGLGMQGDMSLTGYATSKAALMMLPRLVASQYGKQGIRGNAVQIGLAPQHEMPAPLLEIMRDNHCTAELGTPRQIADVVAFLASDESSFVTGTTLVADGGFSSHTPSLVAMRALFEKMGRTGM